LGTIQISITTTETCKRTTKTETSEPTTKTETSETMTTTKTKIEKETITTKTQLLSTMNHINGIQITPLMLLPKHPLDLPFMIIRKLIPNTQMQTIIEITLRITTLTPDLHQN
jgi:hypothetical protein